MSNQYFDWPARAAGDRFVRFDTVRSSDANDALDLVSAGMEKLPIPASLWGNAQNYAVATGSVNVWAASIAPLYLTAYADGLQVSVKFPAANTTTTPTLNLNGQGAKTIVREDGSALAVGDITLNTIATLVYSTTNGQWLYRVGAGLGAVDPDNFPDASTTYTGAERIPVKQSGAYRRISLTNFGTWLFNSFTSIWSSGVGATLRSLFAKLSEVQVSVKDFGALGNGVTNDTAAIVAAITYVSGLGGGAVRLPAGSYLVSSSITVPAYVEIYGDGYATEVLTSSGTANIFTVTGNYSQIRNLRMGASVVRTAGWYVDFNDVALSRARLSDFWMTDAFGGIRSNCPGSITIERGSILDCIAATGTAIHVADGVDISITDVLVDATSQIAAACLITKAGDVAIDNCQFIHGGNALYIHPGAGEAVSSVWANNTFFDTSTRGAHLLAAGGNIWRCSFHQCWFGSATAEGVKLDTSGGGTVDGTEFVGCHAFLNGSDGISVASTGVINTNVIGGALAQNVGSGFGVAANVNEFSVIGARIGACYGLTGNAYGIFITGGTSTNFRIIGNDLRGNTTTAVSNGATGSTQVIENNVGYEPAWSTYTPSVTSSAGTISTLGTVAGRYKRNGKTLNLNVSVAITTNGTGATSLLIPLPAGLSAAADSTVSGRDKSSGPALQGIILAAGTALSVTKYDNTYPGADGRTLVITGTVEVA